MTSTTAPPSPPSRPVTSPRNDRPPPFLPLSPSGASSAALRGVRASDLKLHRLRSAFGRVPSGLSSSRPGHGVPELHALIASVPNVHDDVRSREAAWRAVLFRSQSHPREALLLDRRGRTALHAACAARPPRTVASALLEACGHGESGGGRHGEAAAVRDNHGRTALSVAIASGAAPDVCELLLGANPRSAELPDHGGKFPLHLACCGYGPGAVGSSGAGRGGGRLGEEVVGHEAQARVVRILLEAYPEAAGKECNGDRTPLHMAIEGLASVEVVRMLVEARPECVGKDRCGSTPLTLAIQRNAPAAMIRLMVAANPSAAARQDSAGRYPLRRAVEYHCPAEVIEVLADAGGPDAVTQTDTVGRTALHAALQRSPGGGCAHGVVRALLDRAPHTATARDRIGNTPLDVACRHYCRAARDGGGDGGAAEPTGRARQAWRTVLLLLRAERHGTTSDPLPDGAAWRVLHAALGAGCPAEVVGTALALRPRETGETDEDGRLPLHLALGCGQRCGQDGGSAIVEMLLEARPEAASVPDPADGGRLPLHAAAECGWVEGGALHRILRECPDALQKPDPVTGLYPFQLAALKKKWDRRGQEGSETSTMCVYWGFDANWDLLQTNSVFELLLAGPDFVMQHR